MNKYQETDSMGSVAIIGMAGRFPGARNMDEFWQNLCNGVESVRFFNHEELVQMGIDRHLLDNPRFIAADAILEGMDQFDAAFFDYSAREAEIMDPQHRLFLESAYEALESAGYNSELYDGRIAVYAGANLSGYMIRNLYSNPGLVENIGTFKIMLANGQDFLATKVSYKMNLMGPSVNVNTLCSSSMVAVHYACQNLLNYGCDIALAGGVSFQVSRNEAFFYQEGGIGSSDGHCRAFDSKANGTVSGSGLAVVILKRLEDAIADGDHIHAVILGTGINNDGSSKNSYTAPNVDGQAECIAEAIAMSGVNPETITYIEAHGTGTNLGDPIEIAALTKAFRAYTKKKQFCGIGSVKTNIGHLVNAGGLASLVKTVLSMEHRILPPSLNFEEPNPRIDFANSPFYVNTRPAKWETEGFPLRAGVSSFGIGGTNTHAILEEAPYVEPSLDSSRQWQLITLSARTDTALDKMTGNLANYVKKSQGTSLADIAFTLHAGRRNFNHRRMLVCRDVRDLSEKLEKMPVGPVFSKFQKPKEHSVVFMFPGEGCHYVNVGLELYNTELTYRNAVDHCSKILKPLLELDIRKVLYPADTQTEADRKLNEEAVSRAAIFVTEYALAILLLEWEVKPRCMIGEGVGEYAAACISGVFSVEDALALVSADEHTFIDKVSKVSLNTPQIPFISCRTGNWTADDEAVNPGFWIKKHYSLHIKEGLNEILKDRDRILLETGPGHKFCDEACKLINFGAEQPAIPMMAGSNGEKSDTYLLLESLGKLWLAGGRVNWNKFYVNEKRHRIPLPTYPFERQRYWIEPGRRDIQPQQPEVLISNKEEITGLVFDSDYREGALSIRFNLDSGNSGPQNDVKRKKYIEDILMFKDRLEEFCNGFNEITANLEVSPLILTAGKEKGQTDAGSNSLNRRPRPVLDIPYAEPENETEKIIAQICQEVLGYELVGINDDFFELGGHSLLAVAVISKLRKAFKKDISLQSLFENTTVAKLAVIFNKAAEECMESEDEYEEGQL